MADSSWFRVDLVPVHFTLEIGLQFGLELVWGWLEIYLGLMCGLLRVGSRFSESSIWWFFTVGFGLHFKIVGALLRVGLSFHLRLVKGFL